MRFASLPKKMPELEFGQEPSVAHMLNGVATGIVGGLVREEDRLNVHLGAYALVHHLGGIGGFIFPAEDDERFIAAVAELLRAKLKAARAAKLAGGEYCPEELLPMRMERIGARKSRPTKGGEEHEAPVDPEASAASERVAGEFLKRITGKGD